MMLCETLISLASPISRFIVIGLYWFTQPLSSFCLESPKCVYTQFTSCVTTSLVQFLGSTHGVYAILLTSLLGLLLLNHSGPWQIVHVSSVVGQQKPRYSNSVVSGPLNRGGIRASKTTNQEKQPDCFSTHTQDPITNSLGKFPRWQPPPNKLMAPLLLHVGQGNETRERDSIFAPGANSGHGPLTVPSLWIQLTPPHYKTSYQDLATSWRILSSYEKNVVYQLCRIWQNIVSHSAL